MTAVTRPDDSVAISITKPHDNNVDKTFQNGIVAILLGGLDGIAAILLGGPDGIAAILLGGPDQLNRMYVIDD